VFPCLPFPNNVIYYCILIIGIGTAMNTYTSTFDALYRKEQGRFVQRLLLKFPTLDRDEVEDIVQQAWTELYIRLTTHPDHVPDKMVGYVWQTCHNMALACHNRKTQLERLSIDGNSIDGDDVSKTVESWLHDDAECEQAFLQRLSNLKDALQILTPQQRQLIDGYYYKHESLRELALELGLKSEDVAKTLKYRAILQLRQKMRSLESLAA